MCLCHCLMEKPRRGETACITNTLISPSSGDVVSQPPTHISTSSSSSSFLAPSCLAFYLRRSVTERSSALHCTQELIVFVVSCWKHLISLSAPHSKAFRGCVFVFDTSHTFHQYKSPQWGCEVFMAEVISKQPLVAGFSQTVVSV